ncbi:MAG: deoxyhypusine synthase, partial [Thermoplasmata archaeon]
MKYELSKKVKDIHLDKIATLSDLTQSLYDSGGFTAKKVGEGVQILNSMFSDSESKNFLAFPACIIATGTRGIILELVKRKMVHVIITTSGMLDHDLARIWKPYYHGDFNLDDVELHKEQINRLGNILVPHGSYGEILENKLQEMLEKLWVQGKSRFSTRDLIWEVGEQLDDENSITYWAWKNKIPIFIPGITDGAFGSQLWLFKQKHNEFDIDIFQDEQDLAEIVFTAERSGALIVGGGISKHHTIWWNQFKDGLDYAVYITTAVEYDGSLSGARLREGISWGKLKEEAREVTIDGDATVLLPLMIGAVLENLK